MKTLKITETTHKRLNFYKTDKEFKSFDEAIEYLLRFRYSFENKKEAQNNDK